MIGNIFYLSTGNALHLGEGSNRGRNKANLDQFPEDKVASVFLVLGNELAHSFSFNRIQHECGRLIFRLLCHSKQTFFD